MAQRRNVRIVVADDSPLWQRMAGEMLTEAGYGVEFVSDGRACVNTARQDPHQLSLIVLDVRMPELDGFGVLKELKGDKLTAGIPVLAISSDYREEHIEELKRLGAVGCLNKGLPLEEILFRINRVLYPEEREVRTNPRVLDDILVKYQIENDTYSAFCFNISSGGLFIRTTYPPPENTKMKVSFHLPRSPKAIVSSGMVVWRNEYQPDAPMSYPPGVGVKFTQLPLEDKRAITDHILSRLS